MPRVRRSFFIAVALIMVAQIAWFSPRSSFNLIPEDLEASLLWMTPESSESGDDPGEINVDSPLQLPVLANPQCIVFNHVPKSGGVTLNNYLLKLIAAKRGWFHNSWYEFSQRKGDVLPVLHWPDALRSNATLNSNIIHSGHYTPKFWNLTGTDGKCFQVTVFREPVDRVISAFYYHKHKDEEWDMCLEPAGRSRTGPRRVCRYFAEYQDDMTRRFSGMSKAWNSYIEHNYFSNVTMDHFKAAKANLLKMNAICFLSELNECARRIGDFFGVQYQPPPKVKDTKLQNKGVHRKTVSPEILSKIRTVNAFDIALYEWAWKHFSIEETEKAIKETEKTEQIGESETVGGVDNLNEPQLDWM